MQTFLPYPDIRESARVLDPKRLGNQAYREGLTLLRGGWPNHPASKMWREYRWYLGLYLLACFDELALRGRYYSRHITEVIDTMSNHVPITPDWLGNEELHSSHRANLLRKNPEWYGQFGWTEEPREGYFWPV